MVDTVTLDVIGLGQFIEIQIPKIPLNYNNEESIELFEWMNA